MTKLNVEHHSNLCNKGSQSITVCHLSSGDWFTRLPSFNVCPYLPHLSLLVGYPPLVLSLVWSLSFKVILPTCNWTIPPSIHLIHPTILVAFKYRSFTFFSYSTTCTSCFIFPVVLSPLIPLASSSPSCSLLSFLLLHLPRRALSFLLLHLPRRALSSHFSCFIFPVVLSHSSLLLHLPRRALSFLLLHLPRRALSFLLLHLPRRALSFLLLHLPRRALSFLLLHLPRRALSSHSSCFIFPVVLSPLIPLASSSPSCSLIPLTSSSPYALSFLLPFPYVPLSSPIFHPSIHWAVDPRQRFAPPRSWVPHSARSPLVPGQVARPHFPTAPPTSRHPNLSPPLLTPTSTPRPPTAPPASTLPHDLTCLA